MKERDRSGISEGEHILIRTWGYHQEQGSRTGSGFWSVSGCLPSLTLSTLPSVCWWGEAVFWVFGWTSGDTVGQVPWDGTPRGGGSGNWTGRMGRMLGHAELGAIGHSIQETLNILLAVLHPALLPDDPGRVITEVAPSCGRGLRRGGASGVTPAAAAELEFPAGAIEQEIRRPSPRAFEQTRINLPWPCH